MNYVECKTKNDLERILKNGDIPILREGYWEVSGSATVRAYDSATVTAYGSATVTAYDSATVTASEYVAIHKLSQRCKVLGGVIIEPPKQDTVENWLAYYGITATKTGKVTLFKAVDANFRSGYNWDYTPGLKPEAPDFKPTDGCGSGLHLCASPVHSMRYFPEATRLVACTVKVSEIIPITDGNGNSDKVKVPRIYKCVEVDIDGKKL